MDDVGKRKWGHCLLQTIGVICMLSSIYTYYVNLQATQGIEVDLKILNETYNAEKKLWFAEFEYEVDGQTYKKVSEKGSALNSLKPFEVVRGEYLEGIPESADIGSFNPNKGKNTPGQIFLFCFGLFLFSIPFIVVMIFGRP